LQDGFTAQKRYGGNESYLFIENFNKYSVKTELDGDYLNMETGALMSGEITPGAYGVLVLKAK